MYPLNSGFFERVLIAGFMKNIESSDLISNRYLSEVDEFLVSALNLCPSFAISVFMVLDLSGAPVCYTPDHPTFPLPEIVDTLVLHGLIFRFIYDTNQKTILDSLFYSLDDRGDVTFLLDFLSNPQRSHHHAMDDRTHNSVTECCFSYILNGRVTHFPGIHHWASESKHRPWLWRWRKSKSVMTNIQKLRWRQYERLRYRKKLDLFWALILALNYLPYLLDKATRSGELIALAETWSYRYPQLVSLFPHGAKKAGKAVERYLSRFDGKESEQCVSEVAVGPLLLSSLPKLKFADRNNLPFCLTPPSEPSFRRVQIARESAISVTERLLHPAGSFLHLRFST